MDESLLVPSWTLSTRSFGSWNVLNLCIHVLWRLYCPTCSGWCGGGGRVKLVTASPPPPRRQSLPGEMLKVSVSTEAGTRRSLPLPSSLESLPWAQKESSELSASTRSAAKANSVALLDWDSFITTNPRKPHRSLSLRPSSAAKPAAASTRHPLKRELSTVNKSPDNNGADQPSNPIKRRKTLMETRILPDEVSWWSSGGIVTSCGGVRCDSPGGGSCSSVPDGAQTQAINCLPRCLRRPRSSPSL